MKLIITYSNKKNEIEYYKENIWATKFPDILDFVIKWCQVGNVNLETFETYLNSKITKYFVNSDILEYDNLSPSEKKECNFELLFSEKEPQEYYFVRNKKSKHIKIIEKDALKIIKNIDVEEEDSWK